MSALLKFRPQRQPFAYQPEPAPVADVLHGFRVELDAARQMLDSMAALVRTLDQSLNRALLLTAPERWVLGNGANTGWVAHVTATVTVVWYRSRHCFSWTPTGIGFEEFYERVTLYRLQETIEPTIVHSDPFWLRLGRSTGELLEGPVRISLAEYRRLRAHARLAATSGGAR